MRTLIVTTDVPMRIYYGPQVHPGDGYNGLY